MILLDSYAIFVDYKEILGPTSTSVKLITSAFPPDSSGGGMSKMFASMWAGRLSIWDIEKVSDSFNIVKKSLDTDDILSFTWCFPHDLYILDKKVDEGIASTYLHETKFALRYNRVNTMSLVAPRIIE